MKILLCQIEITKDFYENLKKTTNIIKNSDFDICLFPELSLTSYYLENNNELSDDKIYQALQNIQHFIKNNRFIVIGTAFKGYNTAAIISKDNISFYNKNTLTTYDSKYFVEGKDIFCFESKGLRFGILICRDQNNIDLINRYKENQCDILLQLSAHYYKYEEGIRKLDRNIAIPITRAIDFGGYIFKVNCVGKKNNMISLGSSIIVNKVGTVLRKGNKFSEEIIDFTI